MKLSYSQLRLSIILFTLHSLNGLTYVTHRDITDADLSLVNTLRFHKTHDTLATIRTIIENKQPGLYLRFGDGDIQLAFEKIDMMQDPTPDLAKELYEAFSLNGPTILKCLPLYCPELGGFEDGMFANNHLAGFKGSLATIRNAEQLWGQPVSDVYSHVALAFASTNYTDDCIEFLRFLKTQTILFVGNQQVPVSLRNLLFGNHHSVSVPPRNSYFSIDRIEQETLDTLETMEGYKVIVLAMGCSGRALQKRLWFKMKDTFIFDFGSLLDALCGWKTREWIKVTHFNRTKFLQRFIENEQHG